MMIFYFKKTPYAPVCKRIFAIFAAAFLVSSVPAMAQDAQMAVYAPTSAWLVGPASMGDLDGLAPGHMPCVVANQFANGFTLRLSGGGGRLLAMAIDFRQAAFSPRRKYEIELSVPGQYFQSFAGTAYDSQTLLFGLQDFPDFYSALQNAKTLVIKAAGASVGLNLVGLNDGFRRMNDCNVEKPQDSQTVAHRSSPSPATSGNPLVSERISLAPRAPTPVQPYSISGQKVVPSMPQSSSGSAGLTPIPGGDAASAQAQLMAQAQQAEAMARQLSAGTTQQGQALASNWTNPAVVRPNPGDILGGPSGGATSDLNQAMRWRALKGANLQDVLEQWAAGAGVRLIWVATGNFTVQRSLAQEGGFEAAAQALLEQYSNISPRPVGRVYREPGTSNPVLVVQQD